MIDGSTLPSFREIRERAGLPALDRHGRGACFACEISTGFSQDERKGLWHCFACNAGGDRVAFIQRLYGLDFVGVLRYLGLDTTQPWQPDPDLIQKQREERELEARHAALFGGDTE